MSLRLRIPLDASRVGMLDMWGECLLAQQCVITNSRPGGESERERENKATTPLTGSRYTLAAASPHPYGCRDWQESRSLEFLGATSTPQHRLHLHQQLALGRLAAT